MNQAVQYNDSEMLGLNKQLVFFLSNTVSCFKGNELNDIGTMPVELHICLHQQHINLIHAHMFKLSNDLSFINVILNVISNFINLDRSDM